MSSARSKLQTSSSLSLDWDAAARLPKFVILVKFLIFFRVNHMTNRINQFASKKSDQSEQSYEFDSNLQMLVILKASQKIKIGLKISLLDTS